MIARTITFTPPFLTMGTMFLSSNFVCGFLFEKRKEIELIPLNYKLKVVNMAKQNPTWSLKTLLCRRCVA